MYDELKLDYIYPMHHIRNFQKEVGMNQQPTDEELFDQLYYMNLNKNDKTNLSGQQAGESSANLFINYD